MEHVVLASGTTFFKYKDEADREKGGPGESLSHRLFKIAISKIARTRLKLKTFGEHEVEIKAGATEKEIVVDDGKYFADVYLRFTSATNLGLRWEGELYVEVHHTHEVPVEKQQQLRELEIPVIEVNLPDLFLYRYEDDSTAQREEEHVAWIRKTLEGGFLAGTVISDRRSKEFLEASVQELGQRLDAANAGRKAMEDGYNRRIAQADQKVASLSKEVVDRQSKADRIEKKFDSVEDELSVARGKLAAANENLAAATADAVKAKKLAKDTGVQLAALRKQMNNRLLIEGVVGTAAACALIAIWLR